jgi:predicted nucleic acid-binding protein
MLSLDTHIVVALLDGSLRKAEERRVASEEIAISGIVLWELANRSLSRSQEPEF